MRQHCVIEVSGGVPIVHVAQQSTTRTPTSAYLRATPAAKKLSSSGWAKIGPQDWLRERSAARVWWQFTNTCVMSQLNFRCRPDAASGGEPRYRSEAGDGNHFRGGRNRRQQLRWAAMGLAGHPLASNIVSAAPRCSAFDNLPSFMPAINPKILLWARETAGLARDAAVMKIGLQPARGIYPLKSDSLR